MRTRKSPQKNTLRDEKANVRLAAAVALGAMHAERAKIELEGALEDAEPAVVLAAANSLLLIHDDLGYDICFAAAARTGEESFFDTVLKAS